MIIQIPFQGFYGSELEAELDDQVDYIIEDDWEFQIDRINWASTFSNVAQEYTRLWLAEMGLEGVFYELTSPMFYNFKTDEVFVDFPTHSLERIKAGSLSSPGFKKFVEDTCSSRDGFHSFLPADLGDWDEEWEARYYHIALLFLDEVEERVIGIMRENGGFELEY